MANPEFKENCGNGENITIEAGNICNWQRIRYLL